MYLGCHSGSKIAWHKALTSDMIYLIIHDSGKNTHQNANSLSDVQRIEGITMAKELYTIGYAGFPNTQDFLNTLKNNGVQILIDVRSSPFSAYYAAYNKDVLSNLLKENGIYYFNFARQFGARQESIDFYKNGRLDFETFSSSEQFLDGVRKVDDSNAVVAFMCAEKKPSECHRTILVAKAFSDKGQEVTHLMPDGERMTQHDVEQELLEAYFPDRAQASMFEEENKSEEEYIVEAYRRRNDEIGFKWEDLRK